MEFYLRLAELFNVNGELPRGLIAEIRQETGMSRWQVAALLHNKAKSIDFDSLSKICDYLSKKGIVADEDLPAALFGRRPNHFWALPAMRKRIEFCIGVRRDPNWCDQLVMAADSELQARMVYGVTGTHVLGWDGFESNGSADGHLLNPRLVPSPMMDDTRPKIIQDKAREVYRGFIEEHNDKALILLGSVKSNPVVELAISGCFRGSRAFRSEDTVAQPADRSCPFLLVYREKDPHPASVCGGERLSSETPGNGPGIYFESESGSWEHCPWNEKNDAALVFYRLHKAFGQLEMVLGGFSSRATRCLANFLRTNETQKLWPPVYTDGEVDIGIFVLRFGFRGKNPSMDSFEPPHSTEVLRLPREPIARRLRSSGIAGA